MQIFFFEKEKPIYDGFFPFRKEKILVPSPMYLSSDQT